MPIPRGGADVIRSSVLGKHQVGLGNRQLLFKPGSHRWCLSMQFPLGEGRSCLVDLEEGEHSRGCEVSQLFKRPGMKFKDRAAHSAVIPICVWIVKGCVSWPSPPSDCRARYLDVLLRVTALEGQRAEPLKEGLLSLSFLRTQWVYLKPRGSTGGNVWLSLAGLRTPAWKLQSWFGIRLIPWIYWVL